MPKVHTHYDNLKVARDAPPDVIKAAYRTLSQRYHPDREGGDEEKIKFINRSYDVLRDPQSRAEHDQWIRDQESQHNPAPSDLYEFTSDFEAPAHELPQSPKKVSLSAAISIILIVLFAYGWLTRNPAPKPASASGALSAATLQCESARKVHGGQSWASSAGEKLAPLSISTSIGQDYLIKLVNRNTGAVDGYIYLRGGAPFKTDVPLGQYEMRYASGPKWCNTTDHFGPQTQYAKVLQPLDFAIEQGQYAGYVIDLTIDSRYGQKAQPISSQQF